MVCVVISDGKNIYNKKHNKMTPEQLLTPRFEVMVNYPNSLFPKGIIIDFNQNPRIRKGKITGNAFENETFFNSYPDIFRKMHWSEGRAIEDMPEYVAIGSKYIRIFKVDKWIPMILEGVVIDWKVKFTGCYTQYIWFYTFLQPATLEQYEAYQKTKKK